MLKPANKSDSDPLDLEFIDSALARRNNLDLGVIDEALAQRNATKPPRAYPASADPLDRASRLAATGPYDATRPRPVSIANKALAERETRKQKGILDASAESFSLGAEQAQTDTEGFEVAMGFRDPKAWNDKRKSLAERQAKAPAMDKERNWLGRAWQGAAQMAPAMMTGAAEGGTVAGTVAALGQAGPQVALPEEVITVPAAFTLGSGQYWYRQGVGSIYGGLIDQGVDPKIAASVASGAGVPYALLEGLQVSRIFPFFGKVVQQHVNRSLARILLKSGMKYGGDIAKETAEEVAQEMTAVAAEETAKAVDNILNDKNLPRTSETDALKRYWETAKGSVGPLAILLGPARGAGTARSMKARTDAVKWAEGQMEGLTDEQKERLGVKDGKDLLNQLVQLDEMKKEEVETVQKKENIAADQALRSQKKQAKAEMEAQLTGTPTEQAEYPAEQLDTPEVIAALQEQGWADDAIADLSGDERAVIYNRKLAFSDQNWNLAKIEGAKSRADRETAQEEVRQRWNDETSQEAPQTTISETEGKDTSGAGIEEPAPASAPGPRTFANNRELLDDLAARESERRGETVNPESFQEAEPETRAEKTAMRVAQALGLEPVFISSNDKAGFDGAVHGGKVILSKESESTNPVRFILGHEVGHVMEEEAPELYQALKDEIDTELQDVYSFAEGRGYASREDVNAGKGPEREAMLQELRGDLIGKMFEDDGRLARLEGKSPGILIKVREVIDRILERLGVDVAGRSLGELRPFVKDAKKVQASIDRVVGQFTRERARERLRDRAGKTTGVQYSSKRDFDATRREIAESEPVVVDTGELKTVSAEKLRIKAEDYYRKNLSRRTVFQPELKEIRFPISGHKKAQSASEKYQDKLRLFSVLPELIAKSRLLGSEKPRDNQQLNVKAYHLLGVRAVIDGAAEPTTLEIQIREDDKGNMYYDHYVKKPSLHDSGVVPESTTLPRASEGGPSSEVSNKNIAQDRKDVKSRKPRVSLKRTIPDFKDETGREKAVRVIQDRLNRLEVLQKQAGGVKEEFDTRLAAELFEGRVGYQLEQLDKYLADDKIPLWRRAVAKIWKGIALGEKSFLRRLTEGGYSVRDLGEFMYAQHATERRSVIFERQIAELEAERARELKGANPSREGVINRKFDGRRAKIEERRADKEDRFGAGISEKEAAEILKQYEGTDIQAFADEFRRTVIEPTLDRLHGYGEITDEQYETYKKQFKYYVPLKGIAKKGTFSKGFGGGIGQGFSTSGKFVKQAAGRSSVADNPFAQAIVDAEHAIMRDEKNRVGQKFLEFTRQFPSERWAVTETQNINQINADGEIEFRDPEKPSEKSEVLVVHEGGKTLQITINDEALARAMKRLGVENTIPLIGPALNLFQNFQRAVITTFSPVFPIFNFLRDTPTAVFNVASDLGFVAAAKVLTIHLPRALAGVTSNVMGKGKTEWGREYEELKAMGGKVGWFDNKPLDKKIKSLERKARRFKKRGILYDATKEVGDFIKDYNEIVESGIRLAVYHEMKARGASKAKAAAYAKNITVNFNKKGEVGGLLNSLFLFSNAAIQGIARPAQSTGLPLIPKTAGQARAQAMLGVMIAGSFALAAMNRAVGPDDWDEVDNYVKDNHVLYHLGGGRVLSLVLPYGLNVPWVLGQLLEELVNQNNPDKVALLGRFAGAVSDAVNPLGSGAPIEQMIAPTALDLPVQLATGKNFFGGPIAPAQPPYGPKKPNHTLYYRSARPQSVALTKWLSEATATERKPYGYVDISSEYIDHVVDFMGGGLGKFLAEATATMSSLITEKQLPDTRVIPVVRRFYREPREGQSKGLVYDMLDEAALTVYTDNELARWQRALDKAKNEGSMDNDAVKRLKSQMQKSQLEVLTKAENLKPSETRLTARARINKILYPGR